MNIGSKIRKSRVDAKLTQEQTAEALGISRQTISNWENEKSYPDIVSVLKMSDLYQVSLDYLLKGESSMSSYMDYLDESTNQVKSRRRLSALIVVLSYLTIWTLAILWFWFSPDETGKAMVYALGVIWIIIPLTTFILSLLIGEMDLWGRCKWFASIAFGIMYMLLAYMSFSLANNIATGKVNEPNWTLLLVGAVISLLGIGIGHLISILKRG